MSCHPGRHTAPFFQLAEPVIHRITRLIQHLIILLRRLPTPLRRYHRHHPVRPRRRQHPVGAIPSIRQQILRINPLNQRIRRRAVLHLSPPLPPYEPAFRGRPPPGAVSYSAPFGLPDGLIAAHRARAVLMHLDRAGVNHQPLKARVIGYDGQQLSPFAAFLPASERCAVVFQCP